MDASLLIIYFAIFAGLIWLVAVRPQARRRKELETILGGLAPGDEIVTVSGIYGTVSEVEDGETILLEIAEETDIRIAKASIARVIDPAAPETPEGS